MSPLPPQNSADIALIGLAVMGQNLILNMNDHGFVVCAYNRTTQKVDDFLANEAKGTKIVGAHSLKEMVGKLKKPRRVMMLVKGELCRRLLFSLPLHGRKHFVLRSIFFGSFEMLSVRGSRLLFATIILNFICLFVTKDVG